jgi:hypothetical protein
MDIEIHRQTGVSSAIFEIVFSPFSFTMYFIVREIESCDMFEFKN